MNEDLRRTSWNRIAVRLRVPRSIGVFLVATDRGRFPGNVLMVGSARNLRSRLLDLLPREDLREANPGAVHWVSELTLAQARVAERFFTRRYDPPFRGSTGSRWLDVLAG